MGGQQKLGCEANGQVRPRVLLNATTINKGGGIQAVVAFIRDLYLHHQLNDGFQWVLAVSPQVRDELTGFGVKLRPDMDLCLTSSPARSRNSRHVLREFAAANADVAFTFFGPAYVKFPCPHICGVADGWVTHSTWLAYSRLPGSISKLRVALLSLYKALWFRQADRWIVEQEAARNGLVGRLRLPPNRIHIVANNCAQGYLDAGATTPGRRLQDPVRVLTFAANYPNKCLDLVPEIAAELAGAHEIPNVEFVVTIPAAEYGKSAVAHRARQLGVERFIANAGFVSLREGPNLYRRCDIVLMPTVLETFSATYPEAMAMGLPILTTELGFARHICQDAALYFTPLDSADAARKLARLLSDPELRSELVAAGRRRLLEFPTPEEKHQQIRLIVESTLAASSIDGHLEKRAATI